MPTTVVDTIEESGGDYSTIAAWEAATDNDLVTDDEIRVGELHERASTDWDEANIVIAGATVDATRYRRLTVALTDRHNGTEGSGTIINPTASGHVLNIQEAEFHVDWIVITDWVGDSSEAIRINANNFRLSQALIHDGLEDGQDGVYRFGNDVDVFINNCFFWNIDRGAVYAQICQDCNFYLYNVSGWDLSSGPEPAAAGFGFDDFSTRNNSNSTMFCKNVTSHSSSHDAFHGGGASGQEGTVDATTCACNDTSLSTGGFVTTDGNEIESVVQADQFVSLTGGSVDLHLKSGNDLERQGTDLSSDADLSFSDDIDGEHRFVPWDIGGDQFTFPSVLAGPLIATRIAP